MRYQPIETYGLIGNMTTAALVGSDGSIDWLCLPRFDSPSVFAAILDPERAGCFRLAPAEEAITVAQYYRPETNVLVTRWTTRNGVAEVIDFMPVSLSSHDRDLPDLVRLVRGIYGSVPFTVRCEPAFDYARESHTTHHKDGAVVLTGGDQDLTLRSTCEVRARVGAAEAELSVDMGERVALALGRWDPDDLGRRPWSEEEAGELLSDTCDYWRKWVGACTYVGRWREPVRRSALTLKLLTHAESGAVIAAPTCGLPEHIGGARNWDYRYAWLRDAAYTVESLLRIGFAREAADFLEFLRVKLTTLDRGALLQPVYPIGRESMAEVHLDHLRGYRGSTPIRAGNLASRQFQLDVYGVLLEAANVFDAHAGPLSHDMWSELRELLNRLVDIWREPDHGIWEVRGPPRQFTHSKAMCWAAFDRGVRMAERRGRPGDLARWREQADAAYDLVMREGWNDDLGAFVQTLGGDSLDASMLMMPHVGLLPHADPRMLRTIRAMRKPLSEGGLLSDFTVHRYDPVRSDDGFDEPEGAFNLCTFWLCEAMAHSGQPDLIDEARELLELMLARSGPLCLYPEQVGRDGEALGNYPQGLTHLSLISAVTAIDLVLDGRPDEIGGRPIRPCWDARSH